MLAEKSGKQTIVCRPATWISAAIFPHPTPPIRVAAAAGASKGAAESVEVGLARCGRLICGSGARPRTSACAGSCTCTSACTRAGSSSGASTLRGTLSLCWATAFRCEEVVNGVDHCLVTIAYVNTTSGPEEPTSPKCALHLPQQGRLQALNLR